MILRRRKCFDPRQRKQFHGMYPINWQIVAVLALLSGTLFAQAAGQSFKIEAAGPPRAQIPNELRNGLVTDGIRLSRTVNGVDRPLAELWWVRSLTVRRSGRGPYGVAYRQITPGKTLAVLYLPAAILDVRLQKVPPGFYVLRYARLDSAKDEDEIEDEAKPIVGQYHDYVFLTPLDFDKRTGADLTAPKAIELSRQGSPGKQPALLALPPLNPAYTMFPYTISDDLGHCAVQFKLSVRLASRRAGEMGIAILLVNPPNLSQED